MRKTNALLLLAVLSVTGCALATPVDIFIPSRRSSGATKEYLGHLYPTNNANGWYYSLVDAKLVRELVPIRKMELQGLYLAAKGETELIEAAGTATSNMAWAAITGILTATGIMIPRPQEKAKVVEALHKPVPKA